MHLGNPEIRGHNEKVQYTTEMQAEYIKCASDIVYFAENYFSITSIDEGRQKIKLWDFQKKILKAYMEPPDGKRHVCLLSSRQIGKCSEGSTIVQIRNKKNGEISEITMEELYNKHKKC